MTPAEYAKELVDKFNFDLRPFSELGQWDGELAKRSALIAVDEILSFVNSFDNDSIEFLQEVKQEIEKL